MSDELELDPQVKGGLERSEIARKAAAARWKNTVPRATHEGPLKLGDIVIPSAVLEDGTRVLSRIGFIRAIGRLGKAKGGRKYDEESKIPVFLTAKNLKPFITNELIENSAPIPFRPLAGGTVALGYRADLLPDVCQVFMDAKEAGELQANQLRIAERCRALNKAFSKLGITALVDEATGFQEVRDRQALQAILEKYIGKELAAWEKRFPDDFYRQMYRLRQWEWKQGSTRRTHAVAQYTKDLVYLRIAPDLLKKLEEKNPTDERGRRPVQHHRWLSVDVGQPALAQHFVALLALMKAAQTWDEFKALVNRALPPVTKVEDLPLFRGMASTNGS
jgi:hypothetical protein